MKHPFRILGAALAMLLVSAIGDTATAQDRVILYSNGVSPPLQAAVA